MNTDLPQTIELPTEYLVQHLLFLAKEIGDWDHSYDNDRVSDPDLWNKVNPSNVDYIGYYGDGLIEIEGSFKTAVITEHIPKTFHHPAEVRTKNAEGVFHVMYSIEDEGWAEGMIEVY
mgnify:FL=1